MSAELIGSIPDVASLALGLSDAMAPDKGFAYNLCAFQIDLSEETREESSNNGASAALPRPSDQNTASLAGPPSSRPSSMDDDLRLRPGPIIFTVKLGAVGEGGPRTVVEVGLQELATRERIAGIVELRKLEDFDTSILNNLSIEVTAQDQQIVPRGTLLILKGLVNPTGLGFAHFIGGILVRAKLQGSGRPSLLCEPQFITQAPSRGAGKGLFGQVIESSRQGSALSLWVYRAPLFER